MEGDTVLWIAISATTGMGSVAVGFLVAVFVQSMTKDRRSTDGSTILDIHAASAASDLMPLISGLPKAGFPFDGAELWIFGNDGRYVIHPRKGRKWQKRIAKWAGDGLKVRYILLDADDDVRNALSRMARDIGPNFQADALRHADREAVESVARELETRHPTLFLAADGNRAAWIEGYHGRDSVYAHNVRYYSPTVARRPEPKALIESYRSKVATLLDHCDPIAKPVPAAA